MSNKQILEPKKDIKNENDHWKELTKVRNTTIGNGENILKDSFSNPSTSKPEKTHK